MKFLVLTAALVVSIPVFATDINCTASIYNVDTDERTSVRLDVREDNGLTYALYKKHDGFQFNAIQQHESENETCEEATTLLNINNSQLGTRAESVVSYKLGQSANVTLGIKPKSAKITCVCSK